MRYKKEKIGIILLTIMIIFFLFIIINTNFQKKNTNIKKTTAALPHTNINLYVNKINNTHLEVIWNSQGYTKCSLSGAINLKDIPPGGIKILKIENTSSPIKLICTKLNGSKDKIEKNISSYYLKVIDYDKNAKEGYQTYVVLEWNLPQDSDQCIKKGAWNGKINITGTYKDTNFRPGDIDSYNKTYTIICYKNNKEIFNTSLNLIKWWLE